jgi:hypothetical protein
MRSVTGHVFVVPGTLQSLTYDDVLVSTDFSSGVGSHFWGVFGWSEDEGAEKQYSLPRLSEERRVALVEPFMNDPEGRAGGSWQSAGPRRPPFRGFLMASDKR